MPRGAKYLDLPGLIALHAPRPLWLAGEGQEPAIITAAYRAASQTDGLVTFTGEAAQQEAAGGCGCWSGWNAVNRSVARSSLPCRRT